MGNYEIVPVPDGAYMNCEKSLLLRDDGFVNYV